MSKPRRTLWSPGSVLVVRGVPPAKYALNRTWSSEKAANPSHGMWSAHALLSSLKAPGSPAAKERADG